MNNLEMIQSFTGKEFSASPSPFMRWLKPTVVEAREGNLVFMYEVRKEWLNPVGTDLLSLPIKICRRH